MPSELLFIHGAGDQSEGRGSFSLFARLRSGLGMFDRICAPLMPHPEYPDYAEWEAGLARHLECVHVGTLLVGHSLGGSVLLKYLTEHRLEERVGGVFAIGSPYWGADPDWDVEPFKFRTDAPVALDDTGHTFIYHSSDDEVIPFAHHDAYARKFPGAKLRAVEGVAHDFVSGVEIVMEDLRAIQTDAG